MNRSATVTVIAILVLIGSSGALCMGLLQAIVMSTAPMPSSADVPFPPAFFKALIIGTSLFYILPAIWGLFSGIGLLKYKNWARVSTIVFSVLLITFGAFGILTAIFIFSMPLANKDIDPRVLVILAATTVIFALIQAGIGTWWLIFFNRPHIKAQFSPSSRPLTSVTPAGALYPTYGLQTPVTSPPVGITPGRPDRPLSITIIGWYVIIASLFLPTALAMHSPAILFLRILTGWSAVAFLVAITGAQIYVGVYLLRMKGAGWMAAVGYFTFMLVNHCVFYFAPGARGRVTKFLELQAISPWLRLSTKQLPFQFDIMPFVWVGAVSGIAVSLVIIGFIVAAKPAFFRNVPSSA